MIQTCQLIDDVKSHLAMLYVPSLNAVEGIEAGTNHGPDPDLGDVHLIARKHKSQNQHQAGDDRDRKRQLDQAKTAPINFFMIDPQAQGPFLLAVGSESRGASDQYQSSLAAFLRAQDQVARLTFGVVGKLVEANPPPIHCGAADAVLAGDSIEILGPSR